jgi:hypothetical protein
MNRTDEQTGGVASAGFCAPFWLSADNYPIVVGYFHAARKPVT